MPVYRYRAVDVDGNAVEDTLEAVSARGCVTALRERGLRVHTVEQPEGIRGRFLRREALTWEDLDLLNEQLRTITKSGLPLASSLCEDNSI